MFLNALYKENIWMSGHLRNCTLTQNDMHTQLHSQVVTLLVVHSLMESCEGASMETELLRAECSSWLK